MDHGPLFRKYLSSSCLRYGQRISALANILNLPMASGQTASLGEAQLKAAGGLSCYFGEVANVCVGGRFLVQMLRTFAQHFGRP